MIGIIGASGFIGRSTAEHFAANDVTYRAFMRDPNAAPASVFPGAAGIHAFEIGGDMDMSLFAGLDTLLLATSATKPNLRHNGVVNEVQKNVLPYCQFLTDLRETDIRHVIYLSSGGAVYGNRDQETPIDETATRAPCTPYGYGKMCIEAAIENIWNGDGRHYTILRPSNPVGRHQFLSLGSHGLVTTVFHAVHNGLPVHVFGDGTTVRDYFSALDLAELIRRAAASEKQENLIVNASSGQGHSINDVIAICEAKLGKPAKIEQHLEKQPAIAYNVLSNQLARRHFGWSPTRTLADISDELVANLKT